ncbi:MAG: class A beta-lactamase-related serine hydrolase [Gemmatimonadetes bacterium]|nr:class A beta-lactamase-related serine hydrolase [Gemmatimonadota bacterium]
MPLLFRTRARVCIGVLALLAGTRLTAQQQPPADALDGGFDPAPAVDGFAPWLVPSVDRLMRDAIARGVAPGAAVVIGHRGKILLARGYGRTDLARDAPAATEQTLWDLASVTKVAATTVGAMLLVQDGALDLDAPVGHYLAEWPVDGPRACITVRDLFRHTSGLPAGAPVGRGGPDGLIDRLARVPLRAEPGEDEHYGDLDMVLLGAVIERVAGEPLDQLLERRVYRRLGMTESVFRPLESGVSIDRIAPTEMVRGRLIHGLVHDPIARDLGGVSGNAGLFASAHDLGVLASALLWETPDRVVCREVVRQFTRPDQGARYALGWETAAPGSWWGEIFDRFAFGHVGYTGTSLWIDPTNDVFVVLLTNRVNPSAKNQRHLALRGALHQTVERGLADIGLNAPPPAPVRDGCAANRAAEALRFTDAVRSLPPVRWLH